MTDAVRLCCTECGQMNRVPQAKLTEGPKCGTCGAGLVTGKVAGIDAAAHDKATRGDELPLLVDYWAPWCGPCRQMAPEFSKAAQDLQGKARLVNRVPGADTGHSGADPLSSWARVGATCRGQARARHRGFRS